ncbi:hypothetical protein ScPMuIL_016895 [Solemya velum]
MFPLKTNSEIIGILQAVNGSNVIEAVRTGNKRWFWLRNPPHEIIPIKGSVNVAVTRGFVDFLLHDTIALDFMAWAKHTKVPDEVVFSSLNYNNHTRAPGSYTGNEEYNITNMPSLVRFSNWGTWPCYGMMQREMCVFGVGDLPLLYERPELFANKFVQGFQDIAFDCMEELHFNRTRDQYLGKYRFDVSNYKQFDFVKNHL